MFFKECKKRFCSVVCVIVMLVLVSGLVIAQGNDVRPELFSDDGRDNTRDDDRRDDDRNVRDSDLRTIDNRRDNFRDVDARNRIIETDDVQTDEDVYDDIGMLSLREMQV